MLFLLRLLFIVTLGFGFTESACPPGTIASYSNNSICYLLQSKPDYFLTADKSCNLLNGHLVKIQDLTDDVYLTGKFTYKLLC